MEPCQTNGELMDNREVAGGQSTLHNFYVLQFQSMVHKVCTSQKLEAQRGRVEDTKPKGGRKREEGGTKGV